MQKLHEPIYEKRLEVLTGLVVEELQENDQVLDVGCGGGLLGDSITKASNIPSGVRVQGAEKFPRGDEPITVTKFDGDRLPFDDNSFDVSILADVLHHEQNPQNLLRECARVSRKRVLIKDHKPSGFLGQQRICFMDWAANHPYGVECLYTYPLLGEWHQLFQEVGLKLLNELTSINLYPQPFNSIFGKDLQYWSVTTPVQN